MTPTEPLHPILQLGYDVAKEGLVLLIGFGLFAVLFLRRLLRHEIHEGFERLIHSLGTRSDNALQSIATETTRKVEDGFHRMGGDFVEAFKKSLNDNIIPLLRQSMEDTRIAIVHNWPNPAEVPMVRFSLTQELCHLAS